MRMHDYYRSKWNILTYSSKLNTPQVTSMHPLSRLAACSQTKADWSRVCGMYMFRVSDLDLCCYGCIILTWSLNNYVFESTSSLFQAINMSAFNNTIILQSAPLPNLYTVKNNYGVTITQVSAHTKGVIIHTITIVWRSHWHQYPHCHVISDRLRDLEVIHNQNYRCQEYI